MPLTYVAEHTPCEILDFGHGLWNVPYTSYERIRTTHAVRRRWFGGALAAEPVHVGVYPRLLAGKLDELQATVQTMHDDQLALKAEAEEKS